MKNMAFLFSLLLLLMATACKKETNNPSTSSIDIYTLVGQPWTSYRIVKDSVDVTRDSIQRSYSFDINGKYITIIAGDTTKGNWSVTGNTLTMNGVGTYTVVGLSYINLHIYRDSTAVDLFFSR